MSIPTDEEIVRAQRLGRLAARAGRPVEACPYDAAGPPAQRVLAARFVAAYVAAGGDVGRVDFGDDGEGR